MQKLNKNLKTPFEQNGTMTWNEYPRPQFKRDSYLNLNGKWQLSVLNKNGTENLGQITVPYPPESRISGIERELGKGEKYVYTREFELPENFNKGKIFMHFGAIDQICEVEINGKAAGGNVGGYLPFSLDITEPISVGSNTVKVTVTDNLDTELAYGKQRKNRGGMWYTPISGIWQTVWLESVPQTYIQGLRITPTLDSVTFKILGGEDEKKLVIHFEDGDKTYNFCDNELTIEIENPRLWSPEDPYLYNFTLFCGDDKIESYFALRTVSVKTVNDMPFLCLNGKPYFFNGLLDQGYYSDGIYTPYSPDGFIFDITEMKKLGFNTLRKHIKIEPDLFYYYCDKLGMIVFQDMVNSGKYNFLIDTALPTIGLKKGIKHRATDYRKEQFEKTAFGTIDLLYNHPSVCYYTIFNEGWGQYDADGVYEKCKQIDKTRIYDATSGWFWENKSDVKSEHIYFKPLNLKASDKPLVLSEFGGYSCKIKEHSFNLDKTYGYRFFEETEKFQKALFDLYSDEVIPQFKNGLCATVLTQVSDVEDETNGLVTYDRQILKVDRQKCAELMEKVANEFYSQFE